jgi:hypothetical protein
VLGNSSSVKEMASRAKQEAQRRFHPKVIAQRHLEIYREVLG